MSMANKPTLDRTGLPVCTLDEIEDGFLLLDPQDRVVWFTRPVLGFFPYLTDLLEPGARFTSLVQQEVATKLGSVFADDAQDWLERRMEAHTRPHGLVDERLPDGRWVRILDRETADGGRLIQYRDVTDDRRNTDTAAHFTLLLQSTLETITQGICAFDADWRLLTWNSRFFDLLRLPTAFASVGTPLSDIVHHLAAQGEYGEGNPAHRAAEVLDMIRTTQGRVYERPNRDGRQMEIRIRPIPNGGAVIVYDDISARQDAQRALRQSEERYALAAAGSNDGLWDWDLASNSIYLSTRWKQMLGHTEQDVGDGAEEWFSRIHPEDVQRVTAQLDAHLSGAVGNFESEHRVRHRDGTYRWMLVRGLAVRDTSGHAYRIAGSMTDITDRKRVEEQSIHDALHDNLTGLPNRTLFLERVRQALARFRRNASASFGVVYLDLDRFKVVNESLGHIHGDDLIIAAARRLEHNLKFGDTVARLGGDEFAMLLEDVSNKGDAVAVCDMLQKALASPFTLSGKEIFTTASMGAAHASEGYGRPEDILRDAELAMYKAKELGKAQAVAFDPNMRGNTVTPLDMETDLRRAIERGELTLRFQPIISLATGRIQGFEALTRWTHSKRGEVQPADFIPLAEETGMIVEIGQWVLRTACEQSVRWHEKYPRADALEISVNLSSRQFNQYDLVRMVTNSLDGTGMDPSTLKLEITESALMENAHLSAQMLNDLKSLKIQVCVDDFGTRYSSLSYLHTFPIDTLKIDKSFVQDMGRNRHNLEIVRTICLLAQNLRLDVIAEGVETPEQLAQLRAIGCGYAQGFLFSPPLDVNAVERLLDENRSW
ncbi:EAL domain-containing protein [Thalassobaculum sp. OXR-137]|uniref:EAL domain-containing protein n=1 Tax=Thalassobaculum sp. OXR-137 TaxID=3100173 RepID=UPI002AC8AC89|nr:EAL domain-containing protein [Thalassobaculum sp. OXR-137]WPZ32458.1 EAL domain-containing protein [Thalassobaculum sp. OXR-137]